MNVVIIIQSPKRSSVPLEDNLDISFRFNWNIVTGERKKQGGATSGVMSSGGGVAKCGSVWRWVTELGRTVILPSSAVSRPHWLIITSRFDGRFMTSAAALTNLEHEGSLSRSHQTPHFPLLPCFCGIVFQNHVSVIFWGAMSYIRLILFSAGGKELRAARAGLTSAVNVFVFIFCHFSICRFLKRSHIVQNPLSNVF